MLRINLLPPTARAAAAGMQMPQLPWAKIAVGAAALLGFWTFLLGGSTFLQARKLSRIEGQWRKLEPSRPRLERTQATLKALQDRTDFLKSLKRPEARWAPRLNLFTDALVADLWFTKVSFGEKKEEGSPPSQEWPPPEAVLPPSETPPDETPLPPMGQPLILQGSALAVGQAQGAPVRRYLKRLKEHPQFGQWFSAVELKSLEQRQVGQEQVGDFVMTLSPTGS